MTGFLNGDHLSLCEKKKHVLELNVKSLYYIGLEYDISSKIITFCCKNFEKALM